MQKFLNNKIAYPVYDKIFYLLHVSLSPRSNALPPSVSVRRYMKLAAQREARMMKEHRDQMRERMVALSPPPLQRMRSSSDRPVRADEWHDPWRRANTQK